MDRKIPVAILGATGCVGQKFVQLLSDHPWFEISALCASERSAGKPYGQAVNWLMPAPLSESIARMTVRPCVPDIDCRLVFSGLDSSVAGEVELAFAEAGYIVVSNCRNHRMDPHVPLLVAEVNADHIQLVGNQKFKSGKIITNPNCSVMGLVLALKPLQDRFGIEALHVATMQAISGAGHPGVASLDIVDNVIPHIRGEEEKVEIEPLKILGRYREGRVVPAEMVISAQCNRVPVTDGHMASVSLKLSTPVSSDEIIRAWNEFSGAPQQLKLPSAPKKPLHYFDHDFYPQPKLHRDLERGMGVAIGRLRRCPLMSYKFSLLSHNTVRGAAGAAILNAELLLKTEPALF